MFLFSTKGAPRGFCKWCQMKVDKGDSVVALCVDRLSPVVTVLLVVFSRFVVIPGIAPNVSTSFRKPRKRERSYFAA